MHLFHTPDIKIPEQTDCFLHTLNEEESKHCNKVLRLKNEDIIHLTDGKGSMMKAKIISLSKKSVEIEIFEINKENSRADFHLHIAVAPTKNNNRIEWFLEKATEIGIDEVSPFIGFHSERRNFKSDRMQKIISSAMKQSLKSWHPQLNELRDFDQLINHDFEGQKFIAHLESPDQILLKDAYHKGKNAMILIGPEGDFSPEEIESAKGKGFIPVSLGNTRLRTETAALSACFTINNCNL